MSDHDDEPETCTVWIEDPECDSAAYTCGDPLPCKRHPQAAPSVDTGHDNHGLPTACRKGGDCGGTGYLVDEHNSPRCPACNPAKESDR
jgi:hypothetical protein